MFLLRMMGFILQEEFSDFLQAFAETRPTYVRVSLTDNEISDLLLSTQAKIDILQRFLKSEKPLCFADMPRQNARYCFSWC